MVNRRLFQRLIRQQPQSNQHVCPECEHHFRISARQRIGQLADPDTFVPMFTGLRPKDPLNFTDLKSYPERIKREQIKTGETEGCQAGKCFIKGRPTMIACLDLTFMMGSMGSVAGEKITRAIQTATDENLPVIIVSCSGGARMQEAALSLMQMAKTSAALARHDDAGGLFISVLTDPTTGGVTASYAMLGDVQIAEPNALIGFAGARVIEQTIGEKLPEGFQRAEYLLDHGMLDRVTKRPDLKDELVTIVRMLMGLDAPIKGDLPAPDATAKAVEAPEDTAK